jgi:hypothetical protein
MKSYRCLILLIAIAVVMGAGVPAQYKSPITVQHRGKHLRVAAPQMHFLAGEALERLHNGATVPYTITLAVVARHAGEQVFLLQKRFLISFDLWEEKYSVVQAGRDGAAASRLSADMAEAWCLEQMPIPLHAVPEAQSFMVKLECSIDESEKEGGRKGNSVLTIAALIDIFSRKSETKPPKWEASGGPFHLDELKRTHKSR